MQCVRMSAERQCQHDVATASTNERAGNGASVGGVTQKALLSCGGGRCKEVHGCRSIIVSLENVSLLMSESFVVVAVFITITT